MLEVHTLRDNAARDRDKAERLEQQLFNQQLRRRSTVQASRASRLGSLVGPGGPDARVAGSLLAELVDGAAYAGVEQLEPWSSEAEDNFADLEAERDAACAQRHDACAERDAARAALEAERVAARAAMEDMEAQIDQARDAEFEARKQASEISQLVATIIRLQEQLVRAHQTIDDIRHAASNQQSLSSYFSVDSWFESVGCHSRQ